MGEKARLRRDLIQAQQQRDHALARAERAEAAAVELEAILTESRDRLRPAWVKARDAVRDWADDLAKAVGL